MARIQEFFDSKINLGPSAAVAFLDNWVETRAGLNRSLMAEELKGGPDVAVLARQEAKIREALGQLIRSKVSSEQSATKGSNDLAKTIIQEASDLSQTGSKEYGATQRAKIAADIEAAKLVDKTNSELSERLETVKDPKVALALENLMDSQSVVGKSGADFVTGKDGLAAQVNAQIGAAGAPHPDSPEYTALVTRAVRAVEKSGDREAAQALAEHYGAKPGQPWSAFVKAKHPGFTQEDYLDVLQNTDRRSAGGNDKVLWDTLDKLAKGGMVGGGSEGSKVGGSVSGLPYDIDKDIADMEKAADDLQKARHDATAKRSGAFRPRSNWMITNANQYTDPEALRRAAYWGGKDAQFATEVGEVLTQNEDKLDPWRATEKQLRERGGLSNEHMTDAETTRGRADAAKVAAEWARRYADPAELARRLTLYAQEYVDKDDPYSKAVVETADKARWEAEDAPREAALESQEKREVAAMKTASADDIARDEARKAVEQLRQTATGTKKENGRILSQDEEVRAGIEAQIAAMGGVDTESARVFKDELRKALESPSSESLGGKLSSGKREVRQPKVEAIDKPMATPTKADIAAAKAELGPPPENVESPAEDHAFTRRLDPSVKVDLKTPERFDFDDAELDAFAPKMDVYEAEEDEFDTIAKAMKGGR